MPKTNPRNIFFFYSIHINPPLSNGGEQLIKLFASIYFNYIISSLLEICNKCKNIICLFFLYFKSGCANWNSLLIYRCALTIFLLPLLLVLYLLFKQSAQLNYYFYSIFMDK